jgi:hypothetical protein
METDKLTPSMFPDAPPLGALRLASLHDVQRIGIVATAGFRHSEVFKFERPYHKQYPEDTIASYRREFKRIILDPEYIVLVACDIYDPDERTETSSMIPSPRARNFQARNGEHVIVGVASWRLEQGSKRKGQFQDPEGMSFPKHL